MAAAIKDAHSVDAELIAGGSGIFEVAVDGKVVASKSRGGFPTDEEVVAAVTRARP